LAGTVAEIMLELGEQRGACTHPVTLLGICH
jgi:hypothetical protein